MCISCTITYYWQQAVRAIIKDTVFSDLPEDLQEITSRIRNSMKLNNLSLEESTYQCFIEKHLLLENENLLEPKDRQKHSIEFLNDLWKEQMRVLFTN